jgi:hypothetical protein
MFVVKTTWEYKLVFSLKKLKRCRRMGRRDRNTIRDLIKSMDNPNSMMNAKKMALEALAEVKAQATDQAAEASTAQNDQEH